MLEAIHVTATAGGKRLVDDVSLSVSPGEMVALVGANGAGKSTLLKLLSGDLRPAFGDVRLAGRSLRDWSRPDLARVRAILPQSSSLDFPFTAFDIALLGRMPHTGGRPGARDAAIAQDALELAAAGDLRNRIYTTLSGGERQRVHLARVLAQVWEAPHDGLRYLLLDEPTASLDLAHQHAALGAAWRFTRAGAGVFVVVHDLNLAARYADRIAVLAQGRLVACGAPERVLDPKLIGEAFGSDVLVMTHPEDGLPLVISSSDPRRSHDITRI
jgi:iron complex transport system ATP-binding protein